MTVIFMIRAKVIVILLFSLCYGNMAIAQTLEERMSILEDKLQEMGKASSSPKEKGGVEPMIHGILRGKYEYQPELGANRFEMRNARLSAEGSLPFRSSYKLEVDLCDESVIKMKDAWVRVEVPLYGKGSRPIREGWRGSALRVTLGQQRMPFSIDAHRNPSAQYFANRSFIAKQVGDMRDVGAAVGYEAPLQLPPSRGGFVPRLVIDAGIYNGSNLDNQKTAWFTSPAYSARIQYFPVKGLAFIPSVQHQLIAGREASYTSLDFGAYYETNGLHLEAEYLRKHYAKSAFEDCNAINAMAICKQNLKSEKSYIQSISYLLRYDYMDNHSDGKAPLQLPPMGGEPKLQQSDAERYRLTAGLTFSVRNKYFPTDIRLNYEKYWYPNGGTPKESEQDKLVAELMIRF